MVKVNTRDFGEIEVAEEKIFHFPNGLFAFEDCHSFALISPLGEDVYPMWLQSTVDTVPCFIVFDPAKIDGAYKVSLSKAEQSLLKLNKDTTAQCLAIAVVPEDYTMTTVNMKCPIVINHEQKLAAQVILPDDYNIRLPIYVEEGAGKC